jgi:hypothetical protein
MVSQDTNAHKYRLKVTAGADYDLKTHQVVPVNGETIRIENEHAIVSLCVRVQNYRGITSTLISSVKERSSSSNRLPREFTIHKPIFRPPSP